MHEDQSSYRGVERIYRLLYERYQQFRIYKDVEQAIKYYKEYQERVGKRYYETLRLSFINYIFERVYLDTIYISPSYGKRYAIILRDSLSGQVEERLVANANTKAAAKFVQEEVITRHGYLREIVIDGGPEFKGALIVILARYSIPRIKVTAYNP